MKLFFSTLFAFNFFLAVNSYGADPVPPVSSGLSIGILVDCREGHQKITLDPGYFTFAYQLNLNTSGVVEQTYQLDKNSVNLNKITGEISYTDEGKTVVLGTLLPNPMLESGIDLNSFCHLNPQSVLPSRNGFLKSPPLDLDAEVVTRECSHQGATVPFLDKGYYVISWISKTKLTSGQVSVNLFIRGTESTYYSTRSKCETRLEVLNNQ